MKNINLIFIIVIFLFSTSCIDEEGKKMMMFVNQIVEEPDRMKEIIEASEYYDIEFTKPIEPDYLYILKTSINAYKNEGIEFQYEPDKLVNKIDGSQIRCNKIYLSYGNYVYSPHVAFTFRKIQYKWILITVLYGY